jgi:hypothetical protein
VLAGHESVKRVQSVVVVVIVIVVVVVIVACLILCFSMAGRRSRFDTTSALIRMNGSDSIFPPVSTEEM